jgi:molecular chaperone IbpA
MAMRSSEFAPLFRTTVGFDRLFDMLENSVRTDWPPYNIEKVGDSEYRIAMAIAGFGPDEVELTQHGAELTVIGQKSGDDASAQYLHRGMANRNFKQVFRLADHVKVADARLENGLLSIQLVREVPEELKPRRIAVTSSLGKADTAEAGSITQDTKPKSKAA